jgi:hypothetical protein
LRLNCLLPPSVKTVFGLGRLPVLARLTRTHVKIKTSHLV